MPATALRCAQLGQTPLELGEDAVGMLLRPAPIDGTAPVMTSATLTSQTKYANAERVRGYVSSQLRYCHAGHWLQLRDPRLGFDFVGRPSKKKICSGRSRSAVRVSSFCRRFFHFSGRCGRVAGSQCRNRVGSRHMRAQALTAVDQVLRNLSPR
jgi:hypothetical protein